MVPSPTCAGSDMVFDCAADTEALRCADCGEMVKVIPRKTFSFAADPAWDRNMHDAIWRARIPNHPPRRN